MDSKSIEVLSHFIERTSMWVYPVNEVSIVSFIHGFEAGINDKTFTSKLKSFLEINYNIYGSNKGWTFQISRYAKEKNIDWNNAFFEIATLVMQDILNND